MEYQKVTSSLERMIGFMIVINRIKELQFILYTTRERRRFIGMQDRDIFTYGENMPGRKFLLPVGEAIHSDWIETLELWYQKEEEENLGLTSRVKLANGRIMHIPMIDFRCPCSEQNFSKVVKTLSVLGESRGFLLKSGNSYHYYGIKLLDEKRWRKFMKRCQGESIIGHDWPLFQLQDGFSILRISTSSAKPHPPKIIAKIGDFNF